MIPVKHIDPDDLPLYAMQILPPDEMEEMTLHLQHSVEARRILAEVYGDLSIFANTAEMHEPPVHARQRLMKHVAREKKVLPMSPLEKYVVPMDSYAPRAAAASLFDDEPIAQTFIQRTAPWAGWLIAAGLAAFAFIEHQQVDQTNGALASAKLNSAKQLEATATASQVLEALKDPAAIHATLTSTDVAPRPSGRITYLPEKGSLIFIASNMEQLDSAKTYELWIIPSDGRAPMPAGTFRPDGKGNASVVLPQLEAGVEAKVFGVTIEDAAGSTVPTMPIIMRGLPS